MMKKKNVLAILAAVLAAGFTACTESEEIARAEQKAMDFSVFTNKTTRGAETTTSLNTNGKKFGVWGYSAYNGTTTTVFDNQEVTHNGTAWTYTPLKFWDAASTYEFYAYYPHQAASSVNISPTRTISFAGFTATPANYTDLMIANKIDRAAGANGNVQFTFNHILSNINLTFKKGTNIGTAKLVLNSVKLYGMDMKGDFTQTAATAPVGTWINTTDAATLSSTVELANTDEVTAANVTYTDMLLIPQSTSSLELFVKYTIGDNNDQTFERTLKLDNTTSSTNPAAWDQNQKITYIFTIDANAIIFDNPTVSDWEPKTEVTGDIK